MRQSWSVNNLTDFVVDSVQAAHAGEAPFYHLRFDRVFPDDFYVEMLQAMPVAEDYRAMSGKSKMVAGRVLRSKELETAFVQKLAPGLKRRFGENFEKVSLYPVPILTRDIPGYRIFKHTDSLWKGITVQFYLPPDNSTPHIGTIFHEVLPNGRKPKKA